MTDATHGKPPATPRQAVRIRNLHRRHPGPDGSRHVVFDGLSLDIAEGEFVCLLGASGSGKTTLLRAIAGLDPLDDGAIHIAHAGDHGACGFVFQQDALLPWRTVHENVVFGLEMQGAGREARDARGTALLARVGLTRVARHYPATLSGGMRQRVNLARALAVDPAVLLMDEPFSALDAQTREIMQRELLAIWALRRQTVLFITHQIDEALYLADRIIVLGANGRGVVADLRVDFPRPRALTVKRSAPFLAFVDRLWNLIEADVVRAASL
ncbi:ABC transporter ATP-binding protein [Caballeronia sp. LZ034LL]|uniref:ABC transporter ATP-binding protein n=1 Tax=Caballeronia sp. LZ034LL TaxID=3038567 RepID=UPI002857735A|nr:ABC transporter ATP-binding protein [Caballeronia sp. LZ034LL]MDR5836054.1 ABC transporter ATP-binding protein [Caballeronia sp. LZ034LL]